MPTWGDLLKEFNDTSAQLGRYAFDEVRRKYLTALAAYTNRNVILYASAWLQKPNAQPHGLSINDEDIQGFMEAMHGLDGKSLDLIMHSPGGSPEAAEALVNYVRSKFDDVRIIVPQAAMSAACMVTCSGDRIVMGKHSSLGPIDPQITFRSALGGGSAPAQAIKDQFDLAKKECSDPTKIAAWVPILGQYGPALLTVCDNAQKLAEEVVTTWLEKYMFRGDKGGKKKAAGIASKLAAHNDHKSHSRHLSREIIESYGLKVDHLEDDQQLQDLALSVFHAATFAFANTPTVKIIENHKGNAFLKHELQQAQVMQPAQLGPIMPSRFQLVPGGQPVPRP